MQGRSIVLIGGAILGLSLASSGLRADAPNDGAGDGASARPLLTLPPPLLVPTATTPASDSRALPAWPEAEPLISPAPTVELTPEGTARTGSSISCGSTNRGALHRPAELPVEGSGFAIPEPWRSRHLRYGTDELVGLIERAATTVQQRYPEATLGVADLSDYDGGAIPRHRSHQSGRDVDLIFYATDEAGQRMPPDQYMPWFNRRGRASYARQPVFERNIPLRFFDVNANWALIRAILSDPHVEVERIFVSSRIERWLLRHARDAGEPEELLKRAQRVLHRPRNGDSHNDHMHVRILCTDDDVWQGRCRASSAPGRRRLHARVRCPRPLRRRAPEIADTRDTPGDDAAGAFAFPAGTSTARTALPSD